MTSHEDPARGAQLTIVTHKGKVQRYVSAGVTYVWCSCSCEACGAALCVRVEVYGGRLLDGVRECDCYCEACGAYGTRALVGRGR
jgi:hypothetical protein